MRKQIDILRGAVASFAEGPGWLVNQARMAPKPALLSLGIMAGPAPVGLPVVAQPAMAPAKPAITFRAFIQEVYNISTRLVPLFFGFTFVGYLLNGLIAAAWVVSLFGAGPSYSIPLAAMLGLPFYINTEASLPLVRAMLESGMSQGAALAFLITGAGTSLGALGGALTIARWRVIAIVIGTLWLGSVVFGFLYNLLII